MKSRILLCPCDEKWFFACVQRKKQKSATSIVGIPVDLLHGPAPSHISRRPMVICTTGYIPYDGDFSRSQGTDTPARMILKMPAQVSTTLVWPSSWLKRWPKRR